MLQTLLSSISNKYFLADELPMCAQSHSELKTALRTIVSLATAGVIAEYKAVGGIVVMGDSALRTDFRFPASATPGHPGPSQVAEKIHHWRFWRDFCGRA
jgi:hypothetical protein